MLRVIQELAGLGGNVNFIKHEEEFQINKSLIYDSVSMFKHQKKSYCNRSCKERKYKYSCFSEIALLIRLFRLIRLDVSRNVCIQFLGQNVIPELGFRAYLLTCIHSNIGI